MEFKIICVTCMRSSNTSYSGRTTLGKETFGQINPGTTSQDYTNTKHAKTVYCKPSRCVKVNNYQDVNALRTSYREKYFNNQNIINTQKNNLVSGLYTRLNLDNINVIANSTTNVCPTPISTSSTPYLDYTIDPSGNLFGNSPCELNNFINYKTPMV
jgi:hypothetical protein